MTNASKDCDRNLRVFRRSVATAVSAVSVSMIRGPQDTGAQICVTTFPLTGLSYLKRAPEGILIQVNPEHRQSCCLERSFKGCCHLQSPVRDLLAQIC
ncbi:hypothetical protein TNCV_3329671 [Trichonephila clavipes]|nr:hypothetical protein TNCV_3329671 [Trichonephila clavipes]